MANSLIFLDIDGVLNHHEWWNRRPKRSHTELWERHMWDIDPASIGLLNQLIVRTSAHVVISSVWRLDHELHALVGILDTCGFMGMCEGVTPHINPPERGWEIISFMRGLKEPPKNIVILDDDTLNEDRLDPWWVQTSIMTGLTQYHVDKAVEILQDIPFDPDILLS